MRLTWISSSLSTDKVDEELVELIQLAIDCLSEPTVLDHLTWGEEGQSLESSIFLDFLGNALLRA